MKDLTTKIISIMGFTKDQVTSQVSQARATQIITELVSVLRPTHVENACPADPAITGETPLTVRGYCAMWSDTIHAAGVKVNWRNTWAEFEGIYSQDKLVGSNRIPIGAVDDAPTDGQATWMGRVHEFCTDLADSFEDGDIIGFFPEGTGHGVLAGDSTSFVAANVQTNYNLFYTRMKTVVANALPGKTLVFSPADNYTEYQSGWLNDDIPNAIGALCFDHYGRAGTLDSGVSASARGPVNSAHPGWYDADMRALYAARGSSKKIRLGEWGDHWNSAVPIAERLSYLRSMYNMFSGLVDDGILESFGYWRATNNNLEGILYVDANGDYRVNGRGKLLAAAWAGDRIARVPVTDASGNY